MFAASALDDCALFARTVHIALQVAAEDQYGGVRQEYGFEAVDDWPEFAGLLKSRYDLVETRQDEFIEWRLYVRRRPKA